MPAPTPVVVVANEEERKKHVEVCVRIRPLVIGKESSSSFFQPKRSLLTSPRKPQIPRPSSKFRTPTKTPESSKKTPQQLSPPPPPKNNIYAWDVLSSDTVTQSPATDCILGRTLSYTLDRVYGPNVSTQTLYDSSVQDLVHAACEGYHTAVLAYGQTSTGKTHTMTGTNSQPGLIPLAVQECFEYILKQQQQSREYLLRISYLEVYKEHIRDLLATGTVEPVRLFDSADGLVIKGLQEKVVTSPNQVFKLLAQGEAQRQVGATHMNQHSSRSHVIVRLWIESRGMTGAGAHSNNCTAPGTVSTSVSSASSLSSLDGARGGGVRISSLSLVDLAGSESVRLSGSSERRQEGHYINKSLMTLGQVVNALSERSQDNGTKKQHIPYRDSKLTRLLQPSLSGNAQVVLVCCISPLVSHIEESHNTFKFAMRAKKIPQKATIQEATDDDKTLLQSYREEIEVLKQQLKELRQQQEQYMKASEHSVSSMISSSGDSVAESEMEELVEAIQTMEKLILKTSPASPAVRPEDLFDFSANVDDVDDEEENLLALVSNSEATPAAKAMTTPQKDRSANKDFQSELSRIQGLLGSVLKKRMTAGSAEKAQASASEKEVRNLRVQLEEQQVATSLRKADSTFLQAQLEEKDNLLHEVSKILEAVEERQAKLEAENAALRKELAALKYAKVEI